MDEWVFRIPYSAILEVLSININFANGLLWTFSNLHKRTVCTDITSPPPPRALIQSQYYLPLLISFQLSPHYLFFSWTILFFIFLATPVACRNSRARDRTWATAAVRATAVTIPDP